MEQAQIAAQDNRRLEYEMTVCEIERELDFWRLAKFTAERAGGHSADANRTWEDRQSRMDYLLEELFTKMGSTALQGESDGNRPQ